MIVEILRWDGKPHSSIVIGEGVNLIDAVDQIRNAVDAAGCAAARIVRNDQDENQPSRGPVLVFDGADVISVISR